MSASAQRLDVVGVLQALEQLVEQRVERLEQRREDLVLAAEVVVERRLRDVEAIGDLAQRRALVALLDEELVGHGQDAFAGVAAHGPPNIYLTTGKVIAYRTASQIVSQREGTTRDRLPTGDGPVIRAEGLRKIYGEQVAVDDVSLDVEHGRILGVLGPNGAGKSTTVRMLTTMTHPDAGAAWVAGHDVIADPQSVRRVIGVTGQDATLDELLTGRQNLELVGTLSDMARPATRARATELLEEFELTFAADRMVKTYSGGMRRRLDLAASLMAHPPVLFLDEPTTGLDPTSRAAHVGRHPRTWSPTAPPCCSPRSTSTKPTRWPTPSR